MKLEGPAEGSVGSDIEYPEFGVMVKIWFVPLFTVTEPLGLIVPPVPALAVMA